MLLVFEIEMAEDKVFHASTAFLDTRNPFPELASTPGPEASQVLHIT
jgi:hypothetical protein